jgi:hypothetical protein
MHADALTLTLDGFDSLNYRNSSEPLTRPGNYVSGMLPFVSFCTTLSYIIIVPDSKWIASDNY